MVTFGFERGNGGVEKSNSMVKKRVVSFLLPPRISTCLLKDGYGVNVLFALSFVSFFSQNYKFGPTVFCDQFSIIRSTKFNFIRLLESS